MVSLVIEYERALKKDIFVGSRLCACCDYSRSENNSEAHSFHDASPRVMS